MTRSTVLLLSLTLAGAPACAPTGKQEADTTLAPFAIDRVPDDVKHPTFIDFGSKLVLAGYDVSPEDTARPGESVHLKLYWKRTGQLEPGWGLFTHVEDERGRQIGNFDREGSFRAALGGKTEGLALLELGRVYADEQTVTVPKADVATPMVTIVVGAWNDQTRLSVISGPTNGHDAAIVAHLATGVARPAPVSALSGTKK